MNCRKLKITLIIGALSLIPWAAYAASPSPSSKPAPVPAAPKSLDGLIEASLSGGADTNPDTDVNSDSDSSPANRNEKAPKEYSADLRVSDLKDLFTGFTVKTIGTEPNEQIELRGKVFKECADSISVEQTHIDNPPAIGFRISDGPDPAEPSGPDGAARTCVAELRREHARCGRMHPCIDLNQLTDPMDLSGEKSEKVGLIFSDPNIPTDNENDDEFMDFDGKSPINHQDSAALLKTRMDKQAQEQNDLISRLNNVKDHCSNIDQRNSAVDRLLAIGAITQADADKDKADIQTDALVKLEKRVLNCRNEDLDSLTSDLQDYATSQDSSELSISTYRDRIARVAKGLFQTAGCYMPEDKSDKPTKEELENARKTINLAISVVKTSSLTSSEQQRMIKDLKLNDALVQIQAEKTNIAAGNGSFMNADLQKEQQALAMMLQNSVSQTCQASMNVNQGSFLGMPYQSSFGSGGNSPSMQDYMAQQNNCNQAMMQAQNYQNTISQTATAADRQIQQQVQQAQMNMSRGMAPAAAMSSVTSPSAAAFLQGTWGQLSSPGVSNTFFY